MHDEARRWVKACIHDLSPTHVVELGSLDVNGSLRDLFDCAYTGVDMMDGPGVDVVADAAHVEGLTADLVLCCEVLEHTPYPHLIVENARRILSAGGTFVVTCAGTNRSPHGQHGAKRPVDGEWYRNVKDYELESWLELAGFENRHVERKRQGADLVAVAS